MPIPDFQTIMLPLLQFCSDGKERSNRETMDALASHFGLTENERKELLPSGQQTTFENRAAWAKAHMKMAGLIENTGRGVFRITPRGLEALSQQPQKINLRWLQQYPEYLEAKNRRKPRKIESEEPEEKTPEEVLEEAYQSLRDNLAGELLQQLKNAPPAFFENVVVEVLLRMGYGGSRKDAGQAIGKAGDGGIDGIIKEDKLGLDIIYLQAKRWGTTVGRPEIQKFAGALQGQRARKGVFITTSDFSADARDYAARIDSKIVLIDGDQLAHLMIDHNVGVTPVANYEIKKIDLDYFSGE